MSSSKELLLTLRLPNPAQNFLRLHRAFFEFLQVAARYPESRERVVIAVETKMTIQILKYLHLQDD
jgi:hypothetical protein